MKYIFIIFLLGFSIYGNAQCGLSKASYPVVDLLNGRPDTTNIPILISGAINNNLATVQQGLCAVKLKFRHPFMKELFVELVSPAGQRITLVGGTVVGTITTGITWDVTFVPCNAAANPDPGFVPQWENDQDWEIGAVYSGQYHPHLNCLETFTTGTVNGVWTLRCIDNDDEGAGSILGAQLIFCQSDGLACNDCNIDPGNINNRDTTVCEKDPYLIVNVNKSFISPIQDNNVYEYTNVIFNDRSIIAYNKTPDLRNLPTGKYTICGLQYAKTQASVLPVVGSNTNPDGLRQLLFARGACAGLSQKCMTITINAPPTPISRNVSICKGQVYELGGQRFNQAGVYNVNIKGIACDTPIILNLQVISPSAKINSLRDSINCLNPTMVLQGSNNGTSLNDLKYLWRTTNGNIIGDTTQVNINISKEGTYILYISSAQTGCTDSTTKIIFRDNSFPKITLFNDSITCEKESVDIRFSLSQAALEQKWISRNANPFVILSDGIRVDKSDWYVLTVKGLNGCITEDSVFVKQNKDFTEPSIEITKITCIADTAKITTNHDVIPGQYQYLWSGLTSPLSNQKEPFYLIGGTYSLLVKNLTNGCSKTIEIPVVQDKNPPSLDLSNTNINCGNTSTTPMVTSDQELVKFKWTGNNFSTESSSPELREKGTYKLSVTSGQNGCTAEKTFEITRDTSVANIGYVADQLSCNKDSVVIMAVSDKELQSFFWTGPQGFTSTVLQPKVGQEGTYILNFIGTNGCAGQKLITIGNSVEVPNVVFKNDTLRCGGDTVQLKILNSSALTQIFNYNWSGPDNFSTSVSEPSLTKGGTYRVTITNPASGCKIERQYLINDDRFYTTPTIIFDTLSCIRDSAKIAITNDGIKSVKITGLNFVSESKNTFVRQPGIYSFLIINDKNCPSSGTVEIIRNDTIPVVSAIFDKIKCGQDSILLRGNSSQTGTQYFWKNNTGFVAAGSEVYAYKGGNYQLEGVAPNGCRAKFDFTINYDTIATAFKISKPDTITCIRKVVTLKTNLIQPAGNLKWQASDTASVELKVSNPGIYYAKYTAANNCVSVDSVSVPENRNFPTFEKQASIITCKDLLSTVSIMPNSASNTIVWSNSINPTSVQNGTFTFNTSFGGSYKFQLTNPEGCVSDGEVEVLADTLKPTIVRNISDTLTCQRLTTAIGVELTESAIEYLWNGPGVIDKKTDSLLTVNQGGNYFLKITGKNHCVTNTQFTIQKNVELPRFSTFSDTLNCDNGKINIGINPITQISQYHWDGPDDFRSELGQPKVFSPGTYSVTVTGANGCSSVAEIKVAQDITKPIISMKDTVYLPCDTSPVILALNTNNVFEKYRWVYPDGEIVNTATPQTNMPGNYIVQVTGKNGCTSILKKFIVKVNDLPLKYNVKKDTINCQNSQATLQVNSSEAGFASVWISPTQRQFNTPVIRTDESGLFTLIVSNADRCFDTVSVLVERDTISPLNNILVKGAIQCEIKTLTLEGTKPPNPSVIPKWTTSTGSIISSPNTAIVQVNKPGDYFYELKNNVNKCVSIKNVTVSETPQKFTSFDTQTVPSLCSEINNGILRLSSFDGIAPYTVELNGQKKGNQIQFFNLEPGQFKIIVSDSFGCKVEKQIIIPRGPDLSIKTDKEKKILFGDSLLITPELGLDPEGRAKLIWKQSDKILCSGCKELYVRPFVNTIYDVEYSIDGFCKQNASILVRVENDIESAFPNIFAPNSFGNNQFFYIPQTRGIEKINYIKIFDRWAENVYVAYDLLPGDISSGWDGKFDGQFVAQGVYVVIAELLLSDGTVWKYKGDITVVR